MILRDVIKSANGRPFRRKRWTHADWITIAGLEIAYGKGQLYWLTGERVALFYVDDLTATDWYCEGDSDEAKRTVE